MGRFARVSLTFDLVEQLGALRPAVVDKSLHVLLKASHRLLHVDVPVLGTPDAGLQVKEVLVCPLVSVDYRGSLSLNGLVFALLRPHSLVLEKGIEGLGKVLHQRRLLVICLQEACLVRLELFQFLLEELSFVVGD